MPVCLEEEFLDIEAQQLICPDPRYHLDQQEHSSLR